MPSYIVGLVAVVMVFAIPILGIALAGYKEWLKFKAKHRELGSSTREVEQDIDELHDRLERVEAERDALRQRLQNLETIVTSEAWIAQHEETEDLPSLDASDTQGLDRFPSDDDQRDDATRTAEIARRLRNR